ncbi:beta-N-acetylhexosaminidase family protein [Virgibacillus sp. L01]|uniref:beta-N-acetylhexosaminidase family protein n=1 Tax=Virgibacillus sp. L01 TaxID=3457429 RepID=UPI003FD2B5A0
MRSKSNFLKSVKKVCLLGIGILLLMGLQQGKTIFAKEKGEITIHPTPQELIKRGDGFPLNPKVGLVIGENTDDSAIREVEESLEKAGVKKVVRKNADEPKPKTPVTIWLGGPSQNSASGEILEGLNTQGPAELDEEGYVLASGMSKEGQKQVVLAGKDAAGTYYAAETFDQLIKKREGRDWIPAVEIRDWPEMPIRGSIEGFYGPPWTHEDRLSQLEFYGENKLNTYIYAPKDDPYHRENWREPYPEEELAKVKELIDTSKENHVDFTFSLSPGQSICYSGEEDFTLLKQKMETMWDIGVRSYAIFLDDISKSLHCEQDQAKFGDAPNPIAAAHAYLLNRFSEEFIQQHEAAKPLITVPTDYSGNGTTEYREQFAELLHKDTIVMWTGPKVVSEQITSEGAQKVRDIFQHDLLLWDNYPVNDYDRNSLFLGPLVKRDADITGSGVTGLTSNPMNEAEASKIPLYTIADYSWNPADYEPRNSWEQSIQSFGGDAADVLRTFAENSYSSPINDTESLTLTPLIKSFWESYVSNDAEQAADKLIAEFEKLQQVPQKLQQQMENEKFLEEVKPYMEKLELYGEAGEVAVNYLMAQKDGQTDKANEYREKLMTLFNQSEQIPQKIGQGVIKPFLVKSALTLPSLDLTLQPTIDAFWKSYDTNDAEQAADKLAADFEELKQISETLKQNVDNEEFLKAIEPYLQNLEVHADAGETAVNYLMAQKEGQSDEASQYEEELRTLMVQANKIPQKIGQKVIRPFLIDSMWKDLDVVDYRKLDGINTFRGGGELIQYTPEHGDTTGTNQWGYEVTVVDGTVTKRGGNNSLIPENGYVLSIHANDWLRDNATTGTSIQIENGMVLVVETDNG